MSVTATLGPSPGLNPTAIVPPTNTTLAAMNGIQSNGGGDGIVGRRLSSSSAMSVSGNRSTQRWFLLAEYFMFRKKCHLSENYFLYRAGRPIIR